MKIDLVETKIPGCFQIKTFFSKDLRGSFIKIYHIETFKKHNLCTEFVEEYYSVSKKGVLRGLHFQSPPNDHIKMVFCLSGRIMDVVVDIRNGSPTFGKYEIFNLEGNTPEIIYIPKGLAHGFLTLSYKAIVYYKVSSTYHSEYDRGILWNSLGIPWTEMQPILSERDKKFPQFASFNSTFQYKK